MRERKRERKRETERERQRERERREWKETHGRIPRNIEIKK